MRRRRRRDPAPTGKATPVAAHISSTTSSTVVDNVSHPIVTQIRGPTALSSAVEALSRGAPERNGPALGKSEFYHGAQQPGVAQMSSLNPNASSHLSPVGSLSHPHGGLQRILPVNEPQFPQVRVVRTVPSYAPVPV